MPLVATLITSPKGRRFLSTELAHKAAQAVGASETDWLAEGIACDLSLPDGAPAEETEAKLRVAVSSEPVDVVVQEAATRRKQVLVADMDSTIIDQECIDELAAEMGIKAQVAEITAKSMNGLIEFEPALRERVALLAGLDTRVIRRLLDQRITIASGAFELVHTMRKNGAWTALVSGGFDAFAWPISIKIGFHETRANRLLEADGKLTGFVHEPILGRNAKAMALWDICSRFDLPAAEVIAVGDGANDLGMIGMAGTGVALHAKPFVALQAKVRIDHGDLTALLYIQGYRQSDFVP